MYHPYQILLKIDFKGQFRYNKIETKKVNCNLVLSKDSKDPWYLITNLDCNEALKCYRKIWWM